MMILSGDFVSVLMVEEGKRAKMIAVFSYLTTECVPNSVQLSIGYTKIAGDVPVIKPMRSQFPRHRPPHYSSLQQNLLIGHMVIVGNGVNY
jgi:hypothetical protein